MFNNVYKGKKVFVTGHTGFKGSWISAWLLSLGAKVVGYSDEVPTDPSLFEELGLAEKIKDIRGDVRDQDSLREAVVSANPDVVFHLAAHAIVRECFENPAEAFSTNLMGTVNLLDILKSEKLATKAAVFITSDKCYENVEWEYGYREDDQLGGKDPYSASKACAEIAFSAYSRSYFAGSAIKIATARAGNVIGGGDWARDRIVPDTMKAWAAGNEVEIRSPMATRPWQHVLEPLSGYLWLGASLLGQKEEVIGESFNFGPLSNVNKPVKDLIEQMKETWNVSGWFCQEDFQQHKKEANLLKLSCDKALHRLDWLPNLSFPETCEMTVEWYKNFYQEKKRSSWEMTESHIKRYETLAKERNLVWTRTDL